MKLFRRKEIEKKSVNTAGLAEMALNAIHDGVVITNREGVIEFLNPAAVVMTNVGSASNAVGLDFGLVMKLETKNGEPLLEEENLLIQKMRLGQPLERYVARLVVGTTDKRTPIAITVVIAGANRIITFRDITKELEEEGAQMEFISTASHEMRTPVASIEGYIGLALSPQTATIDARARGYLDSAHAAAKHLGQLFHDLLDTTKLEEQRMKLKLEPVELVGEVKQLADGYIVQANEAKLRFQFGGVSDATLGQRRLAQVVYGFIDRGFLREIMGNLIENAIKYTPEGGSIYVNVLGDGDRALINVTDTGIGISADDLQHIFQKFYRADNSQTRTVGGTGLGLYLVKQRVEAMGGKIWAESGFGEGSTFYISLPRITAEEYEKRMIVKQNEEMMALATPAVNNAPIVQPMTTMINNNDNTKGTQ